MRVRGPYGGPFLPTGFGCRMLGPVVSTDIRGLTCFPQKSGLNVCATLGHLAVEEFGRSSRLLAGL